MTSGIWSTTLGSTRYEFMMQIRRKAVWIAMLATSLIVFTGLRNPWNAGPTTPLWVVISDWAIVCNAFVPIVFGVLISDRLPRERRLHAAELLDSLPARAGSRLTGKYFGSAIATAMPLLLVYLVGIAYLLVERHNPVTLPVALLAFVAINVPGLLFVAAFSIAMPSILWVPLYQFLFVGYWFWGNLLSPSYGIPTLSNTLLTPAGSFAASAFFSHHSTDITTISGNTIPGWEGALSIVALLGCGALVLLAAHRYLAWQRVHQ
ncbi:MAG TPA: ABC transporter permease [Nitrolancea sp.]|nr:ABC transporter permease [Nitrolancea sp.]